MTIIRNDRHRVWDNGVLVTDDPYTTDITAETVTVTLQSKARAALNANAIFLALAAPTNPQVVAQVQRLTRETNALIRLLIGNDLLDDTATDT